MAADSFDPPSDYASGSGDEGTSVWLWIGLGCAAVLFLGAGLLVFGGYKGYSCCRKAMKRQKQVRKTALAFAGDLRDANYSAAWRKTSGAFRDRTDREQFEARFQQHRKQIRNSVPQLTGFRRRIRGSNDGKGTWELDVGFMPHAGEKYVSMRLQLVREGKGEEMSFVIDDVELEKRERDVAAEPPARRVRQFNQFIEEDAPEKARSLVADTFDPGSSKDSFRQFLERHEGVFGGRPEFVSLQYQPNGVAVVRALQSGRAGREVRTEYQVAKSGVRWQITGIRVGVEPADSTKAGSDASDTGSRDTATADGS